MYINDGRTKYPKTYHLPWSETVARDDRIMTSLAGLIGQRVIVTEKMDGENTTMYRDGIHARSPEQHKHPSRDWVKRLWSRIRFDIPDTWRLCGENLFAKHSIHYKQLPTFFLAFSLWDGLNCFGWDETVEWFDLLGMTSVPVLYDGIFDERAIRSLWTPASAETSEGYVVRVAARFHMDDFPCVVGKFVRRGHVQTDEHWMSRPVVPNELAKTQSTDR